MNLQREFLKGMIIIMKVYLVWKKNYFDKIILHYFFLEFIPMIRLFVVEFIGYIEVC